MIEEKVLFILLLIYLFKKNKGSNCPLIFKAWDDIIIIIIIITIIIKIKIIIIIIIIVIIAVIVIMSTISISLFTPATMCW